jgi:hypothetical protein
VESKFLKKKLKTMCKPRPLNGNKKRLNTKNKPKIQWPCYCFRASNRTLSATTRASTPSSIFYFFSSPSLSFFLPSPIFYFFFFISFTFSLFFSFPHFFCLPLFPSSSLLVFFFIFFPFFPFCVLMSKKNLFFKVFKFYNNRAKESLHSVL